MSRAVFLASLALLPLLGGCTEGPPAIRLFVDVGARVPDEVDELHVSIAALSPEGRVCQARVGLFNLESADVFPIYVRIEQGADYTEAAAWWVSGWKGDQRALEERAGWAEWPSEGERDVDLTLEAACLIETLGGPCADGEHCAGGECVETDLPDEFLDPAALDDEISCWGGT
jgi:hypothetical protein